MRSFLSEKGSIEVRKVGSKWSWDMDSTKTGGEGYASEGAAIIAACRKNNTTLVSLCKKPSDIAELHTMNQYRG